MSAPINAFPGYEPKMKKLSTGSFEITNYYRGVDLGHGGYVYAEPGCYTDVAVLDSASHHPTSLIQMNYFGEYTKRYKDILDVRLAIKHGDFESARRLFDGKLAKYLDDPAKADQLAQALKIAINSTYGMTSAKFSNPMTHPDNKNNIIALRGAIFIKMLQDEVVARGFRMVHAKTDSIKIPNATPDIIQFVQDFAQPYGYTFEHESTYERMTLVNNSTYIAKYATAEKCERLYGYIPGKNKKKGGKWEPTAAQFAHPVVFKTLFSKEPIDIWDYAETKEVKTRMYLDFNENLPDVTSYEEDVEILDKIDAGKEPKRLRRNYPDMSREELEARIAEGHSYTFVGKVGLYLPVKPGLGGGLLMALRNDKYSAVTGTKGYRWQEFETIRNAGERVEDIVDMRYYRVLIDDAKDAISQYCDFEWFVSNDDADTSSFPPDVNDVPWLMPCKDPNKTVCEDCPEYETCVYSKEDTGHG